MEYLPIVHDFFKLNNKIIIADCPIVIDFRNFFQKSLPVVLDKIIKSSLFAGVFECAVPKHTRRYLFYMFKVEN
jgi:hypothetical protein